MIPFIIAEIGVNHDGDIEKALRLVDAALASGANAVKFQSFSASRLCSPITPKVDYQLERDTNKSHFEMLRKLELSFIDQSKIKVYCDANGIEFLSTPYGIEDAIFLDSIGVNKIKIASADIIDIPLQEKVASFGKLVIVSTGMASNQEILRARDIYKDFDTPVVMMHTTSEYPADIENANLKKIDFLKSLDLYGVGYSDHMRDSICAVMAVAMGCTYFEKHLTLNHEDTGPDHAASLVPSEFSRYVSDIKSSFTAIGSSHAQKSVKELQMASVSRKSLHYKSAKLKGALIQECDLSLMRPGTGMVWDEKDLILGKKLTRNVSALDLVSVDDFN